MCRCTVCSLRTSEDCDLAVREPCCDEAQDLALAPAERRIVARPRRRRVISEEPGQRPLQLALIVHPRQVRVAAEWRGSGHSGAATPARVLARSETARSPRRWSTRDGAVTSGRNGACIGGEVELQERCGDVGLDGHALVPAERRNLVAASVWLE